MGGKAVQTHGLYAGRSSNAFGVLRSDRAVQVNIAIMRAFVRLREAVDHQ